MRERTVVEYGQRDMTQLMDRQDDPNCIKSEWNRSADVARIEVERLIKGREQYFDEIEIEGIVDKGRVGAYPVPLFRAVTKRNLGLLKGGGAPLISDVANFTKNWFL
ncbi:hypothetical protein WDW86_01145 [Bdellovibrionota bacterium FG-2]